ncbi:MAG TPA: YdcF family protein [Candidatus Saccharimonadales bacterium]|nr:YdcF family protein [Candidatus Saccharimonadales bacterium]
MAFLVIALLALLALFARVGHWLVTEDPRQKADAIAVLSGRMPLRVLEAARLYRAGYATEVWLTHESETAESLEPFGVHYVGEEVYNRQILIHEGVPALAIRDLEPAIENTADEVRAIAAELRKRNQSSVIVVTSKVHTRRVRTLWHRLVGNRPRAIVRAASDDPFEPGHWWKTSRDALDVVRELLGLLNAWAGLPLRPTP